jgi:chromate transporter
MLIMLGLAVLYDRYAGSRLAHQLLYGIRPIVVAIVAWAALDLARKVLERRWLLLLIPVALLLYLVGANPVLVLALCGLIGAIVYRARSRGLIAFFGTSWLGPHPERLLPLSLAFLDADFVRGLHWLKPTQLVDAVALGQVTPGPVFTTAAFLGYLFAGVPGALLATLAIFLPGMALVPLLDRVVKVVESRAVLRTFLDAVNAAVIGLIIAVTISLARASLIDVLTVALAVAAFPIILWRPLAAPAVVAFGAIAGVLSGL